MSDDPDDPTDPYGLARFVAAQGASGTYATALAELRRGRKTTHWIWFVFPQLAGLGRSPMATAYAIGSLGEAMAYLAHPVLGPRLLECSAALLGHAGTDPTELLGSIDAIKVRSSMTLFAAADPGEPLFAEVLTRCYGGEADPETLRLLSGSRESPAAGPG